MASSNQDGYQKDQGNGIGNQKNALIQGVNTKVDRSRFPYVEDLGRLNSYDFYEKLFFGNHFDAFNIKMESENYGKVYARLRFIVANFPALISKIVADLLFIEPVKVKVPDGDQAFVDALLADNKFRRLCYESAIDGSYFGDSVFKLRVGPRRQGEDSTIIIDKQTPKIYFPLYNPFNITGEPEYQELSWVVKIGEKDYLRKEIHEIGLIRNELYRLEGMEIKEQSNLSLLGEDLKESEIVRGKRSLLYHSPNWRAGNRWNGISDYFDLETLFYAIDNRFTKIDNILDTHSDPILSLPEGILDEEGKVKREKLRMIERPEGSDKNTDPAYITWDANLEAGFTEIDKLIEITFMMSETSPDILGMGKGQVESGKALKLKLLRTLAKAQRKQIYFRETLIDVIYTAQVLAKEYGISIQGKKLQGDPVRPEIVWNDGLPIDVMETIEQESARLDAGLTTKHEAIMRVDDIDQDMAKKKAEEIKKENTIELPSMNVSGDSNSFKGGNQKVNPQK